MKIIFIIIATIVFATSCSVTTNAEFSSIEPFTLKKGESKQIANSKVKMLSVGHTFGEKGGYVYANLEISSKDKTSNETLSVGKTVSLGDKFLKLQSVNETADPKLSDPFAATSCTLSVENQASEKPKKTVEPTPIPITHSSISTVKPTLAKVKAAKVRLGFGKKSAVVDLENTDDVTLGGESNHRFKLYFAIAKDDKIYYLFEVQSGAAISDPNAPCGGDSPQTLVWLKTDLNLKIEAAKSEVFASCAYNGGRYLQGKLKLTSNTLNIVFQQQLKKTEISYDHTKPENGFEIKELNK